MRGAPGLFEPQGQDQPFSRRTIVAVIVRVGLGDVNGTSVGSWYPGAVSDTVTDHADGPHSPDGCTVRRSARRPGVSVAIAVLVAVSMGSSGLAAAKPPASSLHFDAIPRIGPNWPGDPSGAIGQAAIVTAVNTSIAVYDRAGVALLAPTPLEPLGTFPPGTDVFDPKVVYDPYAHEFVLVFLAIHDTLERSWIVLSAMPGATASDPATWCVHQIGADQVNRDGKQWADYPGLGFARDRVTVTSNQFDFAGTQGFAYAQVLSFDKTGLYDCTKRLKFRAFGGPDTSNPDGTRAFTVQPATSAGTAPADQYLMSYRRARRGGSALVLWRLRQTAAGLKLTRVAIPVGKVTVSPYGTQAGGGLNNSNTFWDPGDVRLVNAFYDPDLRRVYAAHVIFRNLRPDTVTGGYEEAAIRWYEVAPGSSLKTSAVTRRGLVGTAETDAGWPVVATDGMGTLFVTYSRASVVTGEYLSAYVAQIPVGSTIAEVALLAAGDARMEAVRGPERWGDFNAISRDPLDPAVMAVVNQYAKSDGSGPTEDWQETVDLVGA
jgi:hypothetical protein